MGKKVYIAGDMLHKGSVLLREQEKRMLEEAGLEIHSPIDDKEINDKANQTIESNNGLAEKIVLKDTMGIRKSDTIIINPESFAQGTLVELGQIKAYNEYRAEVKRILDARCTAEDKVEMLEKLITEVIPFKKVYAHLEDIRRTDIPEVGDRRSFGVNQYVYGVVLELTDGIGFMEMEDIVAELKEEVNK